MAWTAPRTWVNAEVVSHTLLNTHLKDNLQYLKDVLDGTGTTQAITVVAKGNRFGSASGTAGASVASSDANIKLYDASTENWAGIGANASGGIWWRVGTAGTHAPNMTMNSSGQLLINTQTVFNSNRLTVDGRAAFADAGIQIGLSGTAANNIHMVAESLGGSRSLAIYSGDYGTGTLRAAVTPAGFQVPATAGYGYAFGSASDALQYSTAGQVTMVLNSNSHLTMAASATYYGVTGKQVYLHGAHLAIAGQTGNTPLTVDRPSDDGTLISLRQAGTEEGSISVSGTTVAYNTFMGAHMTQLKPGQEEPPPGGVVVTTGELVPSDAVHYVEDVVEPPAGKDGRATVRPVRHEARADSGWREVRGEPKSYLPYVAGSTVEGDPAVYGVWIGKLRDDAAGSSFGKNGAPIYNVAGLGAYQVRVTDSGGDIAPGDLLCASGRRYEAMRQADDVIRAGTLGKALNGVAWAGVPADRALGYKWAMVSVALYCG